MNIADVIHEQEADEIIHLRTENLALRHQDAVLRNENAILRAAVQHYEGEQHGLDHESATGA